MKKLLNYIYTHYNNQIVNENTAIIHIIHHRLCSSRFIAKLLFNVRIDPFITSQKKSFPHLFDLTSILISNFSKKFFNKNSKKKILDLGTGRYGILSIYLKKKYSQLDIIASDIDKTFLKSAERNFMYNNINVKSFTSNLYHNINETNFDFVFWNLPYYENPEIYLNDFFNQSINRLSDNGTLVIGYNSFATTTKKIIHILNKFEGLKLLHEKNYYWNNHAILLIGKS